MRIILNAIIARTSGSGASQITLNFMRATFRYNVGVEWYYILSEEFWGLLTDEDKASIQQNHLLVCPRQPNFRSYRATQKRVSTFEEKVKPDVVYSILAPSYMKFSAPEVMRCCNAWDVVEVNDMVYKTLSIRNKLYYYLIKKMKLHLMRKAVGYITQSQTVKEGIVKKMNVGNDNVKVIPNVLPMTFQSHQVQHSKTEGINIIYTAAPFPHKNIAIIPRVAHIMKYKYHLENFHFIVTLPKKEKKFIHSFDKMALQEDVKENIVNVGHQTQEQLISLYEQSSIGFFPSLLETFSATLLEYMYFGLPIVASDRGFNKEIIENAALYFTPMDADDAANQIVKIINEKDIAIRLKEIGSQRLSLFKSYETHFLKTIDALKYFSVVNSN